GWVKHALLSHPAPPRPRHIRPLLLRRPQTFFDADLVALQEAPHRAATTGDPSLVHRGDDFIERQIRLPSNQRKQKRRVRLQRRDAAPAWLGSDAPGRLPALPLGLTSNQAASRRDAPDSTASTTRSRNSK